MQIKQEALYRCFQGRKIFVTGHTGFKGSWLSSWLIKLGAKVSGFSLEPSLDQPLFSLLGLENRLNHYIGNICDRQALQKALLDEQPEMVIHLAAQALVKEGYRDPVGTFNTNTMGTLYLLEALRQVPSCKAALFVTTDKVYDTAHSNSAHIEEAPLKGDDPYSSSKACAEQIVHTYVRSNFLPSCLCATARAGNVIGGGDFSAHRLIPDIMRAIETKKPLHIRYPTAIRPWQHVLEPLMGYLHLMMQLFCGESKATGAWNFGPAKKGEISVQELLVKAKMLLPPEDTFEVLTDGFHAPETSVLRLNANKANNHLGWKSQFSVDEALAWTFKWYQTARLKEDVQQETSQQIENYMHRVFASS